MRKYPFNYVIKLIFRSIINLFRRKLNHNLIFLDSLRILKFILYLIFKCGFNYSLWLFNWEFYFCYKVHSLRVEYRWFWSLGNGNKRNLLLELLGHFLVNLRLQRWMHCIGEFLENLEHHIRWFQRQPILPHTNLPQSIDPSGGGRLTELLTLTSPSSPSVFTHFSAIFCTIWKWGWWVGSQTPRQMVTGAAMAASRWLSEVFFLIEQKLPSDGSCDVASVLHKMAMASSVHWHFSLTFFFPPQNLTFHSLSQHF